MAPVIIRLADYDIIQEMLLFRVRVLSGGFVFILQLEQGVYDDQLMLRAKGEETETVVIDLTNTVLANHFLP